MKPKILVIEDNEQNLYLIDYLLGRHGYEVIQARDGRRGIAVAVELQPSLILLDIQLPDRDGYSVARELNLNAATTDIPIVAVTSHAMVGDKERILDAGCKGYIEKPIDPESFVTEIEAHLPGSGTT